MARQQHTNEKATWLTQQDVELDWLEYSQTPVLKPSEINVPETLKQYYRQMKDNKLRPFNSDIDEMASYVVAGRGSGIRSRLLKPGERMDPHPMDDYELKSQVRLVNGLGYGNGFIEQQIKAKVTRNANSSPSSGDDNVSNFVSTSSMNNNNNNVDNNTNFEGVLAGGDNQPLRFGLKNDSQSSHNGTRRTNYNGTRRGYSSHFKKN